MEKANKKKYKKTTTIYDAFHNNRSNLRYDKIAKFLTGKSCKEEEAKAIIICFVIDNFSHSEKTDIVLGVYELLNGYSGIKTLQDRREKMAKQSGRAGWDSLRKREDELFHQLSDMNDGILVRKKRIELYEKATNSIYYDTEKNMAILPEPFTLAPLEASTDENSADELHSNGEEKYTKAIEFDDNEDEDDVIIDKHLKLVDKNWLKNKKAIAIIAIVVLAFIISSDFAFQYDRDATNYTLAVADRYNESATWSGKLDTVKLGDVLVIKIIYKNKVTLLRQFIKSVGSVFGIPRDTKNVTAKIHLDSNMEYISGSSQLFSNQYPDGLIIDNDTVITGGVNIGDYDIGEEGYLCFKTRIIDDNLIEGTNELHLTATITTKGKQHVAELTINVAN